MSCSSSFWVSAMMVSSSSFLLLRSMLRSSRSFFDSSSISFFAAESAVNSFILFSASCISSWRYSISLLSDSNSRLFFTCICCSSYFLIPSLASLMSCFFEEIMVFTSFISSSRLVILVSSPATSSSRSFTSIGSSPRTTRSLSISVCMSCSW